MTSRERSFVKSRNGHDFSLIVGVLVIAVDGLDLIHLDGLGNTNADFCLSLETSRAAALYPCHRDQSDRVTMSVGGTYAHIETVHVC